MKTQFSLAQLADSDVAEADKILRAVHCGFCTATCPTYVLLGDELDSPRGRIYLIKEMLEKDAALTAEVVKHIDRCLSCLACMTTCPSGVNYMIWSIRRGSGSRRAMSGRQRIDGCARSWPPPRPESRRDEAGRPAPLRCCRRRRWARRAPACCGASRRCCRWRRRACRPLGPPVAASSRPKARRRGRFGAAPGCAQQVLAPRINQAPINVLTRHGVEVVLVRDQQCCGALTHHLGR